MATSPAPGEVASLEAVKPGKGKTTVLGEFDLIVSTAEKFVLAVIPTADDITIETMVKRVTALTAALTTAIAKARKGRKIAA